MSKLLPVFRGRMNAKRDIVLDDKDAYLIWKAHFKDGQEVELILRKRLKKRTVDQNSYWWKICQIIAEESGYESADEVHAAMKLRHLRKERPGLPPTIGSTTELSTVEMADLIDKVKREAAQGIYGGGEDGIYIPDAGYFE